MEKSENLFDPKDLKEEDLGDLFSGEKAREESLLPDTDEDRPFWQVLIVDDEEDVHAVTSIALKDFEYKGKNIRFLNAYSGEESIKILKKNPETALILLDVVMETDQAGLEVAKFVREDMANPFIQIILRTGHPGLAPEKEVIRMYEINDYKTKTELTTLKLFSAVLTGLRAYDNIVEIEDLRKNLEEKVKERTIELEMKNNAITTSIKYARRIQNAILPAAELFENHFSDYFILNKPKEVVSGDFYWVNQVGEKLIFTIADCTGHGVPGAFMSILGIMLLEQITGMNQITDADAILNLLRDKVKIALHRQGSRDEIKDGLDLALCVYDLKGHKLQFSGAFNPVFFIRDGSISKIDADQMPIGPYLDPEVPFKRQEINVQSGDVFYLFTDGYLDQFGGEERKKFNTKRFRELLLRIYPEKMTKQKKILDETITNWQGTTEQIDDITVMGIRF
jgi:serine phosphatase RsbU (regulator of sigma subunit)